MRLAFLITLFQRDTRPVIANAIGSCQSIERNYKQTMEVLLRIAANLPDNQSIRLLAAASVSTSAPKYCYDYQKRPTNCKRSGCPYKHKKIPSKSSRPQHNSSDKRIATKHSNS